MKRIFLLLTIVLLGYCANAQNKINGVVTDAQTGSYMKGASVVIPECHVSASTVDDGVFVFKNLPEGKFHICISYVGYKPDTILINLGKKTERYLECKMHETVVDISSVTVTASRSLKGDKVPASIDVVTKQTIQELPVVTIDDAFLLTPGLNASRSYGIFNKTGDVTMRGLNRNIQTLVLLDGIPYSLFDGSANIWNKVNVDDVENVEILKGPNSSLYGANAMAGVININTQKPQKPLEIKAHLFYGTFNTEGGGLNFKGFQGKNNKGFYWGGSGFYRKSNGYIMPPDSIRVSTDVKTYLAEYNTSVKAGYMFGRDNYIEAAYQYSFDNRGTGSKFYEPDGSYNLYKTHFARMGYNRTTSKSEIHVNAFFKKDIYLKQSESVKASGNYTFLNTHTNTMDGGIWITYSSRLGKYNYMTSGADFKSGATFIKDDYHTSTDTIENNGKMNFAGAFVQDELSLLKNKLIILGSLRYDWVRFYGGVFKIYSPTLTTSYLPDTTKFSDKNWFALSPKLGIKYIINSNYNLYALYSSGFRPSNVSDISRTGDVNKGFKLANPDLKPERITSFEIGAGLRPLKWLLLQPSLFYSIGTDFQYFVATGDSVYTSGTNMKPVIIRENVGRVNIAGLECKLSVSIRKNMIFIASYTYNSSCIASFTPGGSTTKDITGNFLTNVPANVVSGGFIWNNRIVNATVTGKFNDKVWVDDENTQQQASFYYFDLKLQRTFYNRIGVALTIQDILNKKWEDSKGLLSPGRIILMDVSFNW